MSSSELNRSHTHSQQQLEEENQDQLEEEQEEELKDDSVSPSSSQFNTSTNVVSINQFLIHLLKDIFIELSPSTQISICLLSFGSFIIFLSLPNQIIIGFIFLFIGLSGIISIITNKYLTFARQRGLISLMKPSIIKDFILHGSIVDIFYEIRNSKLGIPDFLLSQILPLDDPEREMIFERLPEITRNVVSTAGLIYLTPQAIQNNILPLHLQRNNNNNNSIEYNQNDLSDLTRNLSPITGSPHSSQNDNSDNEHKTEQKSLRGGLFDEKNNVLNNTKNKIENFGKKLLWKNQENKSNKNTTLSIISSTSSDSSSDNSEEEEKKDIFDKELNDEIPIQSNLLLNPKSNNENNKNNNNQISWIGKVGKLLTGNDTLQTKPIIKAVIDTRMKELGLQIISYVWKSPFSHINDIQLIVIFICCVGIVSFYLTKNKQIRNKFIKSMKYFGIMALFWIGVLCFIEINIRRKSKLFEKIFNYINKKLFHSEHHKAVRHRKKSYNEMKKSKSMFKMKSNRNRNKLGLGNILNRQIKKKDKKSKFSRTMPFLKPPNNKIIDSPNSVNSNISSSSTDQSDSKSLSPYSTHLKNKNMKHKKASPILLNMPSSKDTTNVLRRRRTSSFT